MNILDKIIHSKIREVAEKKKYLPAMSLEKSKNFAASTISLKQGLRTSGKSGIIAEFKRRSPSSGIINAEADISDVCGKYEKAGVSAISILTDNEFFGGSLSDLEKITLSKRVPLLRKDFIIDEYQVIEAKAAGADAILLIAAALDKTKLNTLHRLAFSLGMDVLVEVHSLNCLDKIPADTELAGINCRDLKSFTFDNDSFQKLVSLLPESTLKIAESGITSPEQLLQLRKYGFDGFLIGSLFMKSGDPGEKCIQFIKDVNKLTVNE